MSRHQNRCNVWVGCQQCDGPNLDRLCTCSRSYEIVRDEQGRVSGFVLKAIVAYTPKDMVSGRWAEAKKQLLDNVNDMIKDSFTQTENDVNRLVGENN